MKKTAKKSLIRLWLSIKNDIYTRRIQGAIIIASSVLLWIFFGLEVGFLWFIFIIFALYDWDSRVIGAVALFLLAMCPFLLTFNKNSLSELVAMYAYIFLGMTAVLQIIEYSRHPEMFKKKHE